MKEKFRLNFLLTNSFKANFTFLMSALAIILYVQSPTNERELCMYAILFSTVADLVLMDYNNIPGHLFGKDRFYAGMILFGATHILYTSCFYHKFASISTFSIIDMIVACIAGMCVFAFSIFVSTYLISQEKVAFKVAVYIYVGLIGIALVVMYIYSFVGRALCPALGITLFLVSDMFILIRETKCDTNLVRKLVWVFYPIGQLLIIFSV